MNPESSTAVVKVIELVGSSEQSFSDAVRNAVRLASRSLRHITGVEVLGSTADVDENGELIRYKVNCKLAFVVDAGSLEGSSADYAPSGAELTLGGTLDPDEIATGGHHPS